jgi:hypothetical protein
MENKLCQRLTQDHHHQQVAMMGAAVTTRVYPLMDKPLWPDRKPSTAV